jgi:hypothetical protein
VQDGFQKFSRVSTNAGSGLSFDFLERYHEDGDEFPNHIVRVTDDKTWVSFVNVEIEEQ